jgi:hypothetical protein
MKSFRQLIAEVAQPKSEDELDFKDKHEIEFIDHPESEEHQHTAEKKSPKRRADYKDGEDMAVYEDLEETFSVFKNMSPAPGKAVSNRAQVKAFKSANDMNAFLTKGDNALHWKPTDKTGLKSGTYKVGMKRGPDGKPARDFIREETDDEVKENAFIAKAAGAYKAGKKKFKLGDKEFPVTIKKDTAKKIVEGASGLSAAIKRAEASRQKALRKAASMVKKGFSHEVAAKNHDVKVDDLKKHMKEEYSSLDEKAVSQAQQKAAAIALAVKKGKLPKSKLQGASKNMYGMSAKDLEDFAKTKLHGLPVKMYEDLTESDKMAAIGAKLQKMAPTEKNDMISNAMAKLGDHLESFGTPFGPKNMKDLVKKTGLSSTVIQMLIKRAGGAISEAATGAQAKALHNLMLKALGKASLPHGHSYTSSIASNGDFVVQDGSGRSVGRIAKGEFVDPLKEDLDEAVKPGANVRIHAPGKHYHGHVGTVKEVRKREYGTNEPSYTVDFRKPGDDHTYSARLKRANIKIQKEETELDEGKWDYPDKIKGKTPTVYWDQGNKIKKDARKEFRKKVKAAAHAELMKPKKSNEETDLSEAEVNYVIKHKKTRQVLNTHSDYTTEKEGTIMVPAGELELSESVDLIENFKAGSVKLNDGSSVLVKDQDAKLLNQLFADLNTDNKKKMMKVAMTDKNGFNEILGFAREAL